MPLPDAEDAAARVGLCAACVHAERIVSSKGSTFYLCRLSGIDPRFRKYPVLPVRACSGYQAIEPTADRSSHFRVV
jgi:hypothetical protein